MSEGYVAIADRLETMIRSGELKPSEALPSTRDLATRMKVSLVTMQRSMKRLHERGLVVRSQQKGTFVNGAVNSKTIGFMMGKDPFTSASPFYRLAVKAYCELAPVFGSAVKLYNQIDSEDPYQSTRQAEADFAEGRLKAIIHTGHTLTQKEWMERKAPCPCLQLPSMDIYDMAFKGVSRLLAQGRRKLKVLSIFIDEWPPEVDNELPGVEAAFKSAGLKMPKGTVVRCGQKPEDAYRFVKELLKDPSTAPDGLLIDHDVVVSGALFAIAEAGLRVPEDIAVACHQNAGAEIFSPFKIDILKADTASLVRTAMDYIVRQGASLKEGPCNMRWSSKTVLETWQEREESRAIGRGAR